MEHSSRAASLPERRFPIVGDPEAGRGWPYLVLGPNPPDGLASPFRVAPEVQARWFRPDRTEAVADPGEG